MYSKCRGRVLDVTVGMHAGPSAVYSVPAAQFPVRSVTIPTM